MESSGLKFPLLLVQEDPREKKETEVFREKPVRKVQKVRMAQMVQMAKMVQMVQMAKMAKMACRCLMSGLDRP